jgi:cytochrome P450
MSDEEIRDELMSLLLADAESTATTLAWAFDFLLQHPTRSPACEPSSRTEMRPIWRLFSRSRCGCGQSRT